MSKNLGLFKIDDDHEHYNKRIKFISEGKLITGIIKRRFVQPDREYFEVIVNLNKKQDNDIFVVAEKDIIEEAGY